MNKIALKISNNLLNEQQQICRGRGSRQLSAVMGIASGLETLSGDSSEQESLVGTVIAQR